MSVYMHVNVCTMIVPNDNAQGGDKILKGGDKILKGGSNALHLKRTLVGCLVSSGGRNRCGYGIFWHC